MFGAGKHYGCESDRANQQIATGCASRAGGKGIWRIGMIVVAAALGAMLAPRAAQAQFVCNQNGTFGLGDGGSVALVNIRW